MRQERAPGHPRQTVWENEREDREWQARHTTTRPLTSSGASLAQIWPSVDSHQERHRQRERRRKKERRRRSKEKESERGRKRERTAG